MSLVKQNFTSTSEDAMNDQINMELYASYVYLSMASYFDRSEVALPGMHHFFKKSSAEENGHAMKLMAYLNKRGGTVALRDIKAPEKSEWGTAKDAMIEALNLEKRVNQKLLQLHAIASEQNDPNFVDFIESEFLQEQVDAIKEIADYVTNLDRVGTGLGEFMFDKSLRE